MVAMSLSMESTGASGRTVRPLIPGSWIDVSGRGEGGPSSIPLSFTFYNMVGEGVEQVRTRQKRVRKSAQMKTFLNKISHGSHTDRCTHLLNFLVSSRWDDVALIARETVGELLKDLGVSFRGRLMMT